MVVAYLASMTVLPALLNVLRLPAEPKPLGYAVLAPADRFLQRYRIVVVACTSIVVLAGLPALLHLQFDFNPNSLRDPNSEAVATLNSLRGDPRIDANTAELIAPAADVATLSNKLSGLPEVARIRSLESFIPDDQGRKLSLLKTTASALNPALNARVQPTPTDAENIAEMTLLAAEEVKRFGLTPKVALLSASNFGSVDIPSAAKMRRALQLITERAPQLEVDGEMHGDAALSEEIRLRVFPRSRLRGEANLLVMPTLDAANIAFNLLKTASGGGVTIGPILLGAARPVHILTPSATVRRIVNMTAVTVADANAPRGQEQSLF